VIYRAVWSMKRGAIDPPERIEPDLEDDINFAENIRLRVERDAPMCNEELWRPQGLTDGWIKRKARRREMAA